MSSDFQRFHFEAISRDGLIARLKAIDADNSRLAEAAAQAEMSKAEEYRRGVKEQAERDMEKIVKLTRSLAAANQKIEQMKAAKRKQESERRRQAAESRKGLVAAVPNFLL